MITNLLLKMELKSDASFGRGDGLAGMVDAEVEYDAATGLPFVRGRTLKGLLLEECANILYALALQGHSRQAELLATGRWLFGEAGSTLLEDGKLKVGPAAFPRAFRQAIQAQVEGAGDASERLTPAEVLESLTALRAQTAVDDGSGAPAENSLRVSRVLLRGTCLWSELSFDQPPSDLALGLLAACALAVRRGGLVRNRGRGRLALTLWDADGQQECTDRYFQLFSSALRKEQP